MLKLPSPMIIRGNNNDDCKERNVDSKTIAIYDSNEFDNLSKYLEEVHSKHEDVNKG